MATFNEVISPRRLKVIQGYIEDIIEDDIDGKSESVEIKSNGEKISVEFYETDKKKYYIADSKEDLIQLTKTKRSLVGAVISLDKFNNNHFEYYLQGYESQRLKNI